jgi:hypothetical protein
VIARMANTATSQHTGDSTTQPKYYGYVIGTGYMGYVPYYDKMMLFATEKEYWDYVGDKRELYSNKEDSNETIR